MAKIYIPVGTTCSGKTTACKNWIGENSPAVLIEADVLRTIFHQKYTFNKGEEWIIFDLIVRAAQNWIIEGYHVAVDDASLFLNQEQRDNFIDQMQDSSVMCNLDLEFIWDFMSVPTEEEVRERSNNRRGISNDEWIQIYKKHCEILENES